jgi:hypothetical protein
MEAWAQYLLTISIDGEVTGEGSLGSTEDGNHHVMHWHMHAIEI